jgi:glycerophosphoryl diester phosphodiesterase
MGADYIEPDLVITKDGVLVARHENEIAAPRRRRPPRVRVPQDDEGDRREAHHGLVHRDFTLAELKTLGPRSAS